MAPMSTPAWATRDPNLRLLEAAARALEPLLGEVVFVGGCVTGLMITDPAVAGTRPTTDVDVIAEVYSYAEYGALSDRLLELGLIQDAREGAPTCRWRSGDLTIDVMPIDEEVLGFANRWYLPAMESSENIELTGLTLRRITPVYFIATKLEAFHGRGAGDYLTSHDLEDVITVVDGRELVAEVRNAPEDVRGYIQNECGELLRSEDFLNACWSDSRRWRLGRDPQASLPDQPERAAYGVSASRTRTLARCRRRTMLATVSVRSSRVTLSRTPGHGLADIVGREASENVGGSKRLRGRSGTESEELRARNAGTCRVLQQPEFPHAQIGVALDLALIGARDLDLHHQIGCVFVEERIGGFLPGGERRAIGPGPFTDVERAVRFHARAGREARLSKTRGKEPLHRAGERARGNVHDVIEDPGQLLVEPRRGHQGDEAEHRVEVDAAERAVPVEGGELDHGLRVGAQDMDRGAERPGAHRGLTLDHSLNRILDHCCSR